MRQRQSRITAALFVLAAAFSGVVNSGEETRWLLPGHGNLVKHAELFERPPTSVASSPPRIWRIRPQAYQNMIGAVLKSRAAAIPRPFELSGPVSGFRDSATEQTVDGPALQLLLRNAARIAADMTAVEMRHNRMVASTYETFDEVVTVLDPTNEEPTDQQLCSAITRQFHQILFRDPTEQECQRLMEFTREGMKRVGRLRAVRNMICAVLLTPESLFRIETGHGVPDEFGRVMLSPREIAFAMAYALTDDRPNVALMDAAESGVLSDRQAVRQQVTEILADKTIAKPRILQFFREYFEYDTAIDIFKDAVQFPHHDAATLVNDTDHLILLVLEDDRNVLSQLLTTNMSYVNSYRGQNGQIERATGQYIHLAYNLPHEWQWTAAQPIELPAEQRAGVLTQPSWLVAMSDNFDNHAIRRGKWIREKLLGGNVPDLPVTVDAQLPDDDKLTLRERMEITTDSYCWQCHSKMNSLGLPFEQFDHFGRWRDRELEEPVITTGIINESGEASLDGPVETPIKMIQRLANSRRVRQVFIRHAFRYWMGRNETPRDAATLQQADRDFLESEGSMNALITSLLTSDSFLYRDAPEPGSITTVPEAP